MPSRITRDDAARMAALAKLDMSGAELDRAARDLDAILDYFSALGAVDTGGIEPSTGGDGGELRADDPAPSLAPADTLANAPDADRDAILFRVPRVLGS